MINPPVTEPLQMHGWYNNNRQELQQLLDMESYKNRSLLLPYPTDEAIVSISRIASSLNIFKSGWVKGRLALVMDDRALSYTACANCQKPLDADVTWIITCPSCKEQSEVFAMTRIPITIGDETGSLRAMLYTPDAETFMPYSAIDIQHAEEHGIDLHHTIATSLQQTYHCGVFTLV